MRYIGDFSNLMDRTYADMAKLDSRRNNAHVAEGGV